MIAIASIGMIDNDEIRVQFNIPQVDFSFSKVN